MKKNLLVIGTGVITGVVALALAALGNPANMGFCLACFLRDCAGACGMHGAAAVQYFRPEIAGIALGALLAALCFRDFRPRGGSSPFTRLVIGFCVMVGALMFLGCPLRMVIRLGGGDCNALLGLAGFIGGVLAGVLALNRGFSLRRAYPQPMLEGLAFPVALGGLFVLSVLVPALFLFSESGPGAMRAPVIASLAGGLIVGGLAQRSRFCMAGGVRDAMLFRDLHLLWGSVALLMTLIVGNLILGTFTLSFAGQPVAHTDGLWNFLGMALVGWGSVLLGGCPLRQLVLAGEGDSDSAMAVLGMTLGAAFCHNFGLAASAKGPTLNGQIGVLVGFAALLVVCLCNCARKD